MRNNVTYFLSEQAQRSAGYTSVTPVQIIITGTTDRGTHIVTGHITGAGWTAEPATTPFLPLGGGRYATWLLAIQAYLDDNNPDTPVGAVYHVVIAGNSAHAAIYAQNGELGNAAININNTDVTIQNIANGRTTGPERLVVGSAPQAV
jgi:hypothetical protein